MDDRPHHTAEADGAASSLRPLIAVSWVFVAVVIGSLLIFGRDVLVPIAIAFLIWNFINALATSYIRIGGLLRPWPMRLSRTAALTASSVTVVAGLAFAIQLVADSIVQLGADAPTFRESLTENLNENLPAFLSGFGIDAPQIVDNVVRGINMGDLLARTATTLTTTAGNIGLIAIYVLFLLLEQQGFDRKLDRLFRDPEHAERARRLLTQIERRTETYLRIKTFVSLLTAAVSLAVLHIFGVDYAGFWAVWIFLLNYIPNLGSIAGVALPSLASLGQFGDPLLTLTLTLILGGFQAVIGNLIEPKLMGPRVNLSPFVIIVSLALWGTVWGIAGLFLCVPLTVILVIICAEIPATRPVAILLSSDGRVD